MSIILIEFIFSFSFNSFNIFIYSFNFTICTSSILAEIANEVIAIKISLSLLICSLELIFEQYLSIL